MSREEPTQAEILAELFFGFRFAKRLLQIDHPKCQFCDKPSVGCHMIQQDIHTRSVIGRCDEHWKTLPEGDIPWRVRWDQIEDERQFYEALQRK